eukprot:3525865-Pyramimonas_sp.AAC.1
MDHRCLRPKRTACSTDAPRVAEDRASLRAKCAYSRIVRRRREHRLLTPRCSCSFGSVVAPVVQRLEASEMGSEYM